MANEGKLYDEHKERAKRNVEDLIHNLNEIEKACNSALFQIDSEKDRTLYDLWAVEAAKTARLMRLAETIQSHLPDK